MLHFDVTVASLWYRWLLDSCSAVTMPRKVFQKKSRITDRSAHAVRYERCRDATSGPTEMLRGYWVFPRG